MVVEKFIDFLSVDKVHVVTTFRQHHIGDKGNEERKIIKNTSSLLYTTHSSMSSRLAFPRVAPNSSEFEEASFFVRQRPRKSVLSQPPPKKRKLDAKIEEITYDGAKREDYLTGFHKRKVQRIKNAKEEDAKKAREERILMRKQV